MRFFKEKAIELGFSEDEVYDISHDYEHNEAIGDWPDILERNEAIIEYLTAQKNQGFVVQEAMKNIRELKSPYEIKAFGLGLSKEDLKGHDWYNVGEATIEYLTAQKNQGVVVQEAMKNIRGLQSSYEINVIELGIPNEDWNRYSESVTPRQAQGMYGVRNSQDVKYEHRIKGEAIACIRAQKKLGVPLKQAWDDIQGLNYFQLAAITLGLLPQHLKGHVWGRDVRFDVWADEKTYAQPTIDYLRNKVENNVAVLNAMEQIRGLPSDQIRGFVEQRINHKNKAALLGLSDEAMAGHDWNNPRIGFLTIEYLNKEIKKGTPVKEAMDNIRGLNGYEIEAVSFGLTLADWAGHDWNDVSTAIETIEYLRPDPFSWSPSPERLRHVERGMKNIAGLNAEGIQSVIKHEKKGMKDFDLSLSQVKAERFDEQRYLRVSAIYRKKIILAAVASQVEAGSVPIASSGELYKNIAKSIAQNFLSNKDAYVLSLANTKTWNAGKQGRKEVKEPAIKQLQPISDKRQLEDANPSPEIRGDDVQHTPGDNRNQPVGRA